MKQVPTVWSLEGLLESVTTTKVEHKGKWIPLRPLGAYGIGARVRAAWLVFTGQADAVKWPGDQ